MKRFHPSLVNLTAALALAAWAGDTAAQQQQREAPRGPARWEADIAKFEAQDKAAAPEPGALVFLGSSSVKLWKLEESFPARRVINRGFGGSTLADSIHFFDRLIPSARPGALVIYAGDNDVARGMSAAEVAADFEKLAGLAAEKLPGVPVIYVAIKPSVKRWEMWPVMREANEAIAAWCAEREDFLFADIAALMLADVPEGEPPRAEWFAADGLHLSARGYAGWAAALEPILDAALGE